MTPANLLAQHTRGLFPYESKFTWARAVAPSVPADAVPGDVFAHFGFPAVVTERLRSGMKAVPDRYEAHAWLPNSMAADEIAAGRFAAVPVQPRQTEAPQD